MNLRVKTKQSDQATPKPVQLQFSLGNLLEITTYASIVFCSFALADIAGLLISVPFVVVIFFARRKKYEQAMAPGLLLLFFALAIPAITETRTPARRTVCSNNLRQIILAIYNYESFHGSLPPAFTTDAAGNKLHSWRVLILPYLEHRSLYDQIDLTKPWNHPVNIKFTNQMPDVFRCPSGKNKPDETTYVAIIGTQTMGNLTLPQ